MDDQFHVASRVELEHLFQQPGRAMRGAVLGCLLYGPFLPPY